MSISLQPENHWKETQIHTIKSLRPTARRQIESLLRRMQFSQNPLFYHEEINKVILYERERTKNRQRGKEFD